MSRTGSEGTCERAGSCVDADTRAMELQGKENANEQGDNSLHDSDVILKGTINTLF
jgi:hypothetical protein